MSKHEIQIWALKTGEHYADIILNNDDYLAFVQTEQGHSILNLDPQEFLVIDKISN